MRIRPGSRTPPPSGAGSPRKPAEPPAADPNDRPDLVFKTSDGYITAGTISDSEWQGFCRASGDPELAGDDGEAHFKRLAFHLITLCAGQHTLAACG